MASFVLKTQIDFFLIKCLLYFLTISNDADFEYYNYLF